jgi:hypothetical protein
MPRSKISGAVGSESKAHNGADLIDNRHAKRNDFLGGPLPLDLVFHGLLIY